MERRKSDESNSRAPKGHMGTCSLPLKIFRGKLGERFGVIIVGATKGNLRSYRDDFESSRRIFRGRLRVAPNFAPLWGALAPPFTRVSLQTQKLSRAIQSVSKDVKIA